MKLNKFLVAAAAVAVLPLSVANAVEEAPVVEKPFLKVNPDGSTEELPAVTAKGTPEVGDAKVEFKLSDLQKPAKPAPAKPVKKVLPKTHAVK